MLNNRELYDKIGASLSSLTEQGMVPIHTDALVKWLISESLLPENQCTGWMEFARDLRLTQKGSPDQASRRKVTQVMTRLHNKCRCAKITGSDGVIRWNCLRPILAPVKQNGLPKQVRAFRTMVNINNGKGSTSTEEYIVLDDTAIAARAKLRLWLLSATSCDENTGIRINVLGELPIIT